MLAKLGVAIIVFSPKPAIDPSNASMVFFIFETALLNSITSFDLIALISMIPIVYPSLRELRISSTPSKLLRTNGLTIILSALLQGRP